MYEELIKQYKKMRKGNGYTQESASRDVDVTSLTISRTESLETSPRLDKFVEMAKGIGCMVVLVPFPKELPPEKVEEEVVEEETKKVVDYDNWDYEDDKK